jgi:hypothetical protein
MSHCDRANAGWIAGYGLLLPDKDGMDSLRFEFRFNVALHDYIVQARSAYDSYGRIIFRFCFHYIVMLYILIL